MTQNATFHNFTSEPFTGYWNGKPKTFRPGEQVHMSAPLAEHFAKHLTNKVLMGMGGINETYTSPKNPAQVPVFMDIFRKAFIPDGKQVEEGSVDDIIAASVQPSMDVEIKKPEVIDQGPAAALAAEGPGDEPQIISTPDEGDDESSFDVGAKA